MGADGGVVLYRIKNLAAAEVLDDLGVGKNGSDTGIANLWGEKVYVEAYGDNVGNTIPYVEVWFEHPDADWDAPATLDNIISFIARVTNAGLKPGGVAYDCMYDAIMKSREIRRVWDGIDSMRDFALLWDSALTDQVSLETWS